MPFLYIVQYPIGKFSSLVEQDKNKLRKQEQSLKWLLHADKTFELLSILSGLVRVVEVLWGKFNLFLHNPHNLQPFWFLEGFYQQEIYR